MASERFQIIEHIIPCCHIREYTGSTAASQEEVLHMHVKQYKPLQNETEIPPGAFTVIAVHGVGQPKEMYEPLWEELLERSEARGYHIRSIWIAGVANMGMSGLLNEDKLSLDFSWMDHSRDLLLMINHFRDEMPRPLIGVGHNFGGAIITNLAFLHPQLFTGLVLLDPTIQLSLFNMGFASDPPSPVNRTLYRRDVWLNRNDAAAAYAKRLPAVDKRCLQRMAECGFRDLPTALYPNIPVGSDPSDLPVTLTTTKYQEVIGQIRQNFSSRLPNGRVRIDRSTHADMDPVAAFIPPSRPEPRSTLFRLPSLRPAVLWVLSEKSFLRLDEVREGIKTCGSGIGGSGGVSMGKVQEVMIQGASHFFPFEQVAETADKVSVWLSQKRQEHLESEREWLEQKQNMVKYNHLVLSKDWFDCVKSPKAFQERPFQSRL